MPDAYFEPAADGWVTATELTRGPWSAEHQHGGPGAALMARAVETVDDRDDLQVVRITIEILRPIPIAALHPVAHVIRDGRRVQLVGATLADAAGPILEARAWRMRTTDLGAEAVRPDDPPPPPPESVEDAPFFPLPWDVGYHTSIDIRPVAGAWGFAELGPSTTFIRARQPLVDGEDWTPLQRVMVAADSGNGVSATLPLDRFVFINPDLTVTLHRYPVDDWVCLDARTVSQRSGIGLATTRLADRDGYIGHGLQTLLIDGR